jgi:murein DD-endopeptidase MepM/ murein hydrolase activator NlpD
MVRRLGFIFLIIFVLGFFDYVGTELSHALSLNGLALASMSANSPWAASDESSNALPAINFSLFARNGAGWSDITQGYGRTPYSAWYINGWHNGVDIAARYGAPIYSPRAGTVIATGNQDNFCPGKGFGKFVAVSDPTDNVVLWYAHLGTISVSPGQSVSKGVEIGTIGDTGLETGTHLHFSVFEAAGFSIKSAHGCGPDAVGQDVNPVPYLEKFAQ